LLRSLRPRTTVSRLDDDNAPDAFGVRLGRDLHRRVEVHLAGRPSRRQRAMPRPRNLEAVLAHRPEMQLDGPLDATERLLGYLSDVRRGSLLPLSPGLRGEVAELGCRTVKNSSGMK